MTNEEKQYIFEACMKGLGQILFEEMCKIYNIHNEDSINESEGGSPKWIEYNKENIEKYKSDDNMLQHARVNKNTFGWMVVKGNKLVGYCGCEGDKIIALEVTPKFRRQKWATKFIRKAKAKGCTDLSVEKGNKAAISLYFRNGFYICGSNKRQLFMTLHNKHRKHDED